MFESIYTKLIFVQYVMFLPFRLIETHKSGPRKAPWGPRWKHPVGGPMGSQQGILGGLKAELPWRFMEGLKADASRTSRQGLLGPARGVGGSAGGVHAGPRGPILYK